MVKWLLEESRGLRFSLNEYVTRSCWLVISRPENTFPKISNQLISTACLLETCYDHFTLLHCVFIVPCHRSVLLTRIYHNDSNVIMSSTRNINLILADLLFYLLFGFNTINDPHDLHWCFKQ